MLRLVTWLVSLAVHAGIALFFLITPGGAALEQGSGADTMVVEQGIAVEGVAKLGEDDTSVEAIEATPTLASQATPPPEEVDPVKDAEVITSNEGPEQEKVFEPKPEEVKEPQPQQIAAIEQEAVIRELESSGQTLQGGDATAQSAYLGSLRSHLERSKVNPRTGLSGTAVVHFVVDTSGNVVTNEIARSSGYPALDQAALASIERAAPFPPVPKGLNKDRIEVSVPFTFSVR